MKNQSMTISDYILSNWNLLFGYFTEDKMAEWKKDYEIKARGIGHDEPWLTLVAVRALFGGKADLKDKKRVDAFNTLLKSSGMVDPPVLDEIIDIQLEKQLPEILSYREKLKNAAFHYFPHSVKTIEEKRRNQNASFEGPTHVDLFIVAKSGVKNICFVIEAKFNSDISKDISYNPVRDQIIRNIDAAIDYTYDRDLDIPIHSFCFLLLTPKIFRTAKFGGNRKTDIEIFLPQRGRFYCYKMDEYRNPVNIHMALPHRHGGQEPDWEQISKRIGWITFEDVYQSALTFGTIEPTENEMIREFMEERNMVEG
jgi:hypothetical protein